MGPKDTGMRILVLIVVLTLAPSLAGAHTDPTRPPVDTGGHDPALLAPAHLVDDPRATLLRAAALAGLDPERVHALAIQRPQPSATPQDAYDRLRSGLGLPPAPLPVPPGAVADALHPLLDATAHALVLQETAHADLDASDVQLLHRLDTAWRASREAEDRTLLAAAWAEAGTSLPGTLDRERIAAAAWTLLDASLTAADPLRASAMTWPTAAPTGDGTAPCLLDPDGVLIVCGPDDDVTSGTWILEVDLGGDDTHRTNSGASGLGVLWAGTNGLPAALALDLEGDDTYSGGAQVQGTGSTTPGVLVDLGGNDDYRSNALSFNFAQGAGNLGGVGLLYDAEGSDDYAAPIGRHDGRTAWDTQGFGILGGIGLLIDPSGNDVYSGGTMAQGVGDFDAVGILLDGDGADHHDATRLAQGFGDGNGIGLALTGGGGDVWLLHEDTGQGAAIGGHGALIDADGSDLYLAFGGRAQGYVANGPAWKPINDVLTLLGIQTAATTLFLDGGGADSYSEPRCNGCTWGSGAGTTQSIGADLP